MQANCRPGPEAAREFSAELVAKWRKHAAAQRDLLFRRNWKNRRQIPHLLSKEDADSFQFVVEWYEEFDEVVGRTKERSRLDTLIEYGFDVNAPPEQNAVKLNAVKLKERMRA